MQHCTIIYTVLHDNFAVPHSTCALAQGWSMRYRSLFMRCHIMFMRCRIMFMRWRIMFMRYRRMFMCYRRMFMQYRTAFKQYRTAFLRCRNAFMGHHTIIIAFICLYLLTFIAEKQLDLNRGDFTVACELLTRIASGYQVSNEVAFDVLEGLSMAIKFLLLFWLYLLFEVCLFQMFKTIKLTFNRLHG